MKIFEKGVGSRELGVGELPANHPHATICLLTTDYSLLTTDTHYFDPNALPALRRTASPS